MTELITRWAPCRASRQLRQMVVRLGGSRASVRRYSMCRGAPQNRPGKTDRRSQFGQQSRRQDGRQGPLYLARPIPPTAHLHGARFAARCAAADAARRQCRRQRNPETRVRAIRYPGSRACSKKQGKPAVWLVEKDGKVKLKQIAIGRYGGRLDRSWQRIDPRRRGGDGGRTKLLPGRRSG